MHGDGVVAEAFLVAFYLAGEVGAFVVGVPAQAVQHDVAFFEMTDGDFRPELDVLPRLAPDEGTDMGLADAHDAIRGCCECALHTW